jgi:4-amino-4-deoxychorismate lyase
MTVGVFETIRVRNRRVPWLQRHAARLTAACGALGVPSPGESLERVLAPWLGSDDAVVRVTVQPDGVGVDARAVPPARPLAVILAHTPHVAYPYKCTDRRAFDAARAEILDRAADEAVLLTPDGFVAEGTISTVFWWTEDGLETAPLSLGVLPGLGRARVQELVPVRERAVPWAALAGRSLFATNAARGVMPIASLDGVPVPADDRTERLAQRFWT